MITTKGQIIEINGTTEWLLFNRLIKKVHPVDFLSLTDCFLQVPNFLFTTSFLVLIFFKLDLWVKLTIPSGLYFLGQIMVNFRFGARVLFLLKYPLLLFVRFGFFIIPAVFAISIIVMKWEALFVVPAYLLTMFLSIFLLTSCQKKRYRKLWNREPGNYDVFKNNAFLLAYKYYASKHKLLKGLAPTSEETDNQDWLKPYVFMREHWGRMEDNFSKKAKLYWRLYLHLENK